MSACPCCGQPVDPLAILFEGRTVQHGGRHARFTPQQALLFGALLEAWPARVSYVALEGMLVGDEVDPAIVKVIICKVREKLVPLGLAIETIYGEGARLILPQPSQAPLEDQRRARRLAAFGPQLSARVRALVARGYGDQAIAAVLRVPYDLVQALRAIEVAA